MSSINPVGRSMNGIKTIETASLIFTDDNSSLNTSAGIVSAQANSTTALNGKINSVGFNTSNGVLTLTKEDGNTLTKDLDGRYLESVEVADIPDLPASKIVSGTLGTARIPDLNASKITAGTLGDARIPNLNASKINDGTLATARIPDLPYVSVGTSGTHTDETIFGVKTFNEPPVCATQPTNNNQLANRQFVLANTGGGGVQLGGTNAFTGTNTFNTNRPSSTLTNPPQQTDFITKANADAIYGTPPLVSASTTQSITGAKTFTNSFTKIHNTLQVGSGQGSSGGGYIYMPYAFANFQQNQETAKITTQGKIGIGTTTPTFPLHIKAGNTGASESIVYTYFRHYTSSIGRASGWGGDKFSLFADFVIMSATFTGASDVRIKKDIMDLSSALPLIEQIKPRTYKYKDPKRGDKMAYGFIAQELEEVIPELIKTTQHKIPNIMKTADVIDGVFTLKEATDLQVGDKIDIYDEDDKELNVKITEIISDKSFKTAVDVELKDKYFIYGKYVDDFKGIEHNGLLPIMLKAIQELNARVKELEATLK